MKTFFKKAVALASLTMALSSMAEAQVPAATRANTLKVVVHANLQILDPVWTTAFITGRHSYLIYDTLYAANSRFEPKPQMAEGHEISADGLVYRIRLREGLRFHVMPQQLHRDQLARPVAHVFPNQVFRHAIHPPERTENQKHQTRAEQQPAFALQAGFTQDSFD